mmetsp:Transcript_40807/g.87040  ORF Transcript_40807/g.87040 Transcript_40807/m.87040 type:complete len:256 (+) Transcript_40807:606-1373(+)
MTTSLCSRRALLCAGWMGPVYGPSTMSTLGTLACLEALRRRQMTCMPKALPRAAHACAMSPMPSKPSVLPRSSPITNLSHTRPSRFVNQRATCLLKWSAAVNAYSASDEENAPLPLVRGSPAGRRCCSAKGWTESTPAKKQCTHRHAGRCLPRHSSSSRTGDAGGMKSTASACAARGRSSSRLSPMTKSASPCGTWARAGELRGAITHTTRCAAVVGDGYVLSTRGVSRHNACCVRSAGALNPTPNIGRISSKCI